MKKIRWNMKDFIINNLQDLFKIQKNFLLLTIPYHFSRIFPQFSFKEKQFLFCFFALLPNQRFVQVQLLSLAKIISSTSSFQRIWCLIFVPDFGPHHNLLLQFKTWCLCQWYTLWIKLGPYFQFVCYCVFFLLYKKKDHVIMIPKKNFMKNFSGIRKIFNGRKLPWVLSIMVLEFFVIQCLKDLESILHDHFSKSAFFCFMMNMYLGKF